MNMQAAAASTLLVGSIMLAIGVARGTLELLFWGCRVARPEMQHQQPPPASPQLPYDNLPLALTITSSTSSQSRTSPRDLFAGKTPAVGESAIFQHELAVQDLHE